MNDAFGIRDTSGQDRVLSPAQRNKPWKRIFIVLAVVALLVFFIAKIVAGWMSASHSVEAQRVRIAEVKRGDLVRDISADGRVTTANAPTLYAIAGGTVALRVVAGDAVQQGQELAIIDSPELRSRLVQEESTLANLQGEARRAVLDAKLARSNAQKLLDQAKIDETSALRELERSQSAFDHGAFSRNQLDRAKDEVQKARIGMEAALRDFKLQGEAADLDAHNKQLLAQRQESVVAELRRQVDALTLRAPFDGQVGQVQVAQGTNVAINAPILSVIDLSVFEVEIRVPESFARDLSIGVPAQIASAGKHYPATVSAVSPEVVNGEVTARLRFDEGAQPPGLRQNQRLSARIVLDTRSDVLKVERGPFVEQGAGYAYVMEGDVAVRRRVRLGVASLGEVEVLEGVRAGERIVVSGGDLFGNAERVKLH
jgi:HlyD family secretion protein